MSTTEDTNAIDEKKTEETGFTPDFKGFITNYISSIIFTIGFSIFIVGGLGLYTTKVAQANILPDDIELAPYTIFDRIIKEDIPIDINIMRPSFWSENKDTVSQKIIFESQAYLDSFRHSIICSLKNQANPNSSIFANAPLFFSSVYDNLIAKNFLIINTLFFYLSYLPESIIMLLYGIFGIFIWTFLYFFNVCISIFYHFINIPQLFRSVPENGEKWESEESISFFRLTKILLFFFLWIPIGVLSTILAPIFFTAYGLINPLFASYKDKQNKPNGVTDFIKNNFAYKKFFFFILATLSLFSNGLKYLGNNSIIGIIVAVGFAYFMGLYSNEIPENGVDGFTSKIRQNMKQSTVKGINNSNPDLVQICKPVPISNESLENKISQGKFREVTTPDVDGGDIDNLDDTVTKSTDTVKPPDTVKPTDTVKPPDTVKPSVRLQPKNNVEQDLKEQLNYYKNKLDLINEDIGRGVNNTPEILSQKDDLTNIISDIELRLKSLIPQTGGKKIKTSQHIKKYNVRLV